MTANQSRLSGKSIILVGLMGAGKTSVGRKLAEKMEMTFIDADEEIVKAAGCSIEDIFELYGESAFRDVEERVIQRLLEEGPAILATGGGAFMNPKTRALFARKGVSVWLRVELDVLVKRTRRRGGRPLLKNREPRAVLKKLMDERYPVYAEADIIIDSKEEGADVTVGMITEALGALSKPAGREARS
jgi:shikimate kinase